MSRRRGSGGAASGTIAVSDHIPLTHAFFERKLFAGLYAPVAASASASERAFITERRHIIEIDKVTRSATGHMHDPPTPNWRVGRRARCCVPVAPNLDDEDVRVWLECCHIASFQDRR